MLFTSACTDGTERGSAPRLAIYEGARVVSDGGVVTVSGGNDVTLRFVNEGDAELELLSLSFSADADADADVSVNLVADGGQAVSPPWTLAVNESIDVVVTVDDAGATIGRVGALAVTTNRQIDGALERQVAIELADERPRLLVSPSAVDFGRVGAGEVGVKELSLLNTGSGELVISAIDWPEADPAFSAEIDGAEYVAASGRVSLDPPVVLAPNASASWTMRFSPTNGSAADAQLAIASNDPELRVVPLVANSQAPCVVVNPTRVDFGGKVVGQSGTIAVELSSCGTAPVTVDELMISGVHADWYAVRVGEELPVTLGVNETLTVDVVFTPQASDLDEPWVDGQPPYREAILTLHNDSFIDQVDVELRGFGVEFACPQAVAHVLEGEEVTPQTTLHLVGSQSFSSEFSGEPLAYRWTVQQPVGSASLFLPSATVADPTFEANVVGTYVFRLEVTDGGGTVSCVVAETTVVVISDEAIHIELLWHTPNDPDETDEGPVAGADLDLHFTHPFAAALDIDGDGALDPWFDTVFDAFWFNPDPQWASLNPGVDDDPHLDRDDTDGAGPENLNLNSPESVDYRIGVHYWNDHGFGPSRATVRVYVRGTLVFEWSDVTLVVGDMWDVGTLSWPSGEVTSVGEESAPKIFPGYQHPSFPSGF